MRLRVMFVCLLLSQLIVPGENKLFYSKAKDDFVLRNIFKESLNDCKKDCLQRSLCYSINYKQSSKTCELNRKSEGAALQKRIGWVYSEKSSFVEATFSPCNCPDGQKCIVSPDGITCVIEECETWASQGLSNVAIVGARSEHICVLDIAKFDFNPESNKYVVPLICASDGRWRPRTATSSSCYTIAFVLKSTTNADAYYTWLGDSNTRSDSECLRTDSCQEIYRNDLVDRWNSLPITKVRFSIFKTQNEVQYIDFNGTDSSYIDWFSHARVTDSNWIDLVGTDTDADLVGTIGYYFSMSGTIHGRGHRRFYINKKYAGCLGDEGWFSAIYATEVALYCPWEKQSSIRYSTLRTADLFKNTAHADTLYILLDLNG